ncbi:MAG: nucleotidyl transferase AbiEii/AbiGii toxin family protein [Campylobacterota bacterium]|nr:nucleotidyl transferase AbiEii/AbiGii toxin family protein [Campylobacterota bacterium]
MQNEAIKNMLSKYNLENANDPFQALREILQELILFAFYREGLFKEVAFYGGTSLRILYGLDRFSEDMDFTLLEPNPNFSLAKYEKGIKKELSSLGFDIDIQMKNISGDIKSAFIKGDTLSHMINIETKQDIIDEIPKGKLTKIKIEVDTNPPQKFQLEQKTILTPVPFSVNTLSKESLFAGKMHALLCRKWLSRPKGRDWYDLIWYLQNGVDIDIVHLKERFLQSCYWEQDKSYTKEELDKNFFKELLKNRAKNLDIQKAKNDVLPFISNSSKLNIWDNEFFVDLVDHIKFIEAK